jgi:hypothetical protein
MADLLIFLEEWEWARQGMIEELSRTKTLADSPPSPLTPPRSLARMLL